MNRESHIYFYGQSKGRVEGGYRFLSNFYRSAFIVDGREYATVEHYFQSVKHRGSALEERIRLAPTAGEAQKTAWTADPPADWELRKEEVMLRALREKFTQNRDLLEKLLSTGAAVLHEDSPYDSYWGTKGKDRLGALLMKVREELRESIEAENKEILPLHCASCGSDAVTEERQGEYTGGGYADYWYEYECGKCGNVWRSEVKSGYF